MLWRCVEQLSEVSADSGKLQAAGIVSGLPTIWEFGLLWFAFQRLANREQEDGTLVLCVR